MTIGERIRIERLKKGLTQAELAKLCGFSHKTNVSRIEHSGNDVTTKQIKRISEKLGVSVAYLMGYEDTDYILETDNNEKILIEVYRNSDATQKENLLQYARMVADLQRFHNLTNEQKLKETIENFKNINKKYNDTKQTG
jgi:transcriptional regulator with XRE-family HTH domain